MSREGITRRDFLKTAGVVAAYAACRYGLPKFTEQLCAPEDGLHTSVLEAHGRANEFLNRNPGLISLMHEKIPHPQLQQNLLVQARLFPPLADRNFLTGMADSFNDPTPEGVKLTEEELFLEWSGLINKRLGLDFEMPGWIPADIIARWRRKRPFKEATQTETHESVKRLDEYHPIPVPVEIIDTEQPITGRFLGDEIIAGVGDIIFNREFKDVEQNRVLGAVLCHEIAHGLDIASNPNLMAYIPDDILAELFRLRLEAIDLVGISYAPYYDSHTLVDMDEELFERGQLTLTARAVYGDVNTISAEEIEQQAKNYPREVLEERLILPPFGESATRLSHRTKDIIQGSDTEPLLPEEEKELAMYLSSMHSEHFAELVGTYLYLSAEFEGEVDDRLLRDLRENKAIQYVDLMINTLNEQTYNDIKSGAIQKVQNILLR